MYITYLNLFVRVVIVGAHQLAGVQAKGRWSRRLVAHPRRAVRFDQVHRKASGRQVMDIRNEGTLAFSCLGKML